MIVVRELVQIIRDRRYREILGGENDRQKNERDTCLKKKKRR